MYIVYFDETGDDFVWVKVSQLDALSTSDRIYMYYNNSSALAGADGANVWDSSYKFNNIETRTINWEEDIYKEQILVGDELTISENQAKEHFLEKLFEIKDPMYKIIFIAFKTNPTLKCNKQRNERCFI